MRILVADDEFDLLQTLESVFEDEGHEVITCRSGTTTLAALEKEKPDLILLDVMLPGRSGLDVLREIRRRPATRDIPVILMSAVLPRVERDEYAWNGFLRKPFTFKQLMDVMKAASDR
jgi:DNA-binding response OmpR family regulator